MVQMVERQTCGPTLRVGKTRSLVLVITQRKLIIVRSEHLNQVVLISVRHLVSLQAVKCPNNLKPFFLGGIFKGIKKAFSGVVKAVSSVVSGVGNFLNSPIGSLLTTAISFVPGFQWVPVCCWYQRQQVRLLRVILWVPSPIRLVP